MNDESRNREYKRQLDRDERFERAVVAFLNSRDGGTILVGVEDDGSVCGVSDPDLVQRQAADRIRNNIRPATMGLFDIGLEERKGKPVVRIVVSSGPDRPYHLKKYGMTPQGCFVRVGSQTQQIPEAEIEAMFARRARTSLRTLPAPNQNLRFEQLRIRYEEHGRSLNEHFRETLELLAPDGRYNLVAYLLADDNNVSIKVAKYAGTDKIDLVENEEYGFCSLLRACDRVLEKLTVENTTSARIGPKYRQERKRYDPIAVREAVINAFVHNDWTDLDTPVFELFSDRLEITSHGSLLPGMTREDLLSGCSRIRNRELMRVFRDVELVEQLGSGMRRMLDAYSPDIFRYTETFFHVVFRFAPGFTDAEPESKGGPKTQKVVQKKGGPKTPKSGPIPPKGGPIKSGPIPPKDGLNKRSPSSSTVEFRIQIFEFLAAHPDTTTRSLTIHFNIARSAIMRHLAHLKTAGVVRFVGTTRNGHWEVCRENETNLANRSIAPVTTQVTAPVTAPVATPVTAPVAPDKSTGQVDRTSRPDKSTGQVDRTSRIRRVATTLPSENRATLLISLVGTRESSRRDLMDAIGLRHRENFYRMYLLPAIDLGLIEYTIPGKPNSRLQKYRLTDKGRAALAAMRKTKAAMQATARPAPPSGRL